MVGSLGNPQSLNRYAYVLNNPLKFTDPTGHMPSMHSTSSFRDGSEGGGGASWDDPSSPQAVLSGLRYLPAEIGSTQLSDLPVPAPVGAYTRAGIRLVRQRLSAAL